MEQKQAHCWSHLLLPGVKKMQTKGTGFLCIRAHTLYLSARTLHPSLSGVLVFHFCFPRSSCWSWCVLFSAQRNRSENIASTNTCVRKGSHTKHKDKTASISMTFYTATDVLPLSSSPLEIPPLTSYITTFHPELTTVSLTLSYGWTSLSGCKKFIQQGLFLLNPFLHSQGLSHHSVFTNDDRTSINVLPGIRKIDLWQHWFQIVFHNF